MVYGYDVKHNGIYYRAGEDVPQHIPMPVDDTKDEDVEKDIKEVEVKKRSPRKKQ